MLWWWNGDYWPWMLVPLAMMILCGFMMFSMMGGHRHSGSRESHALEILKERFAAGDITREEYEQQRRVLQA